MAKTTLHRRTFSPIAVASLAIASFAACGSPADGAGPEQQIEPQIERRSHGPVDFAVDAALSHATVSHAQATTLRAISDSVRMDTGSRQQIHAEIKAVAVDLVRAGSSDTEQFEAAIDRATATMEARMLDTKNAIKDVHATLNETQRSHTAAVMRDQINERFGYGKDGEKQFKAKFKDAFKRFAKHMALSALQIAQLETLRDMLSDEEESERLHPNRQEILALVDAFKGDNFGETVDAFQADKLRIILGRVSRAGDHTNRVLSIFSESQRKTLADLIERGPREVLFGEAR